MKSADVIIIGAGPTGLMLACQLARFNVDFIIIDCKSQPTDQSRALVITSRSLEIYQQMGISNIALSQGQLITHLTFISKNKKPVEINIGVLGEGLTEFPYVFSLEQSRNEELLNEHLMNSGKEVQWNTELTDFKQTENEISIRVSRNAVEENYSCKYLIGCDGAKSKVRQNLKFEFKGGTYENKFFLVDVDIEWDIKDKKLIGMPGEKNIVGFFPIKGDKHYRILGTLPEEFYDREDIQFHDVEKIIREIYEHKIEFKNLNWFSVYKLHHRCVDSFRKRNVFLAGDAAHIHSPAGGQGMNTGLQDSYNLAWKLSFVLKGNADENLLDTYNDERLPFAKWLMNFTDRGFGFMTNTNLFFRMFRKHLLAYIVKIMFSSPRLRKRMFYTVSQLWINYQKSRLSINITNQKLKFSAGDRMPYVRIDSDKSTFSLLIKPNFYLVLIGMKSSYDIDAFIKKKEIVLQKIELKLTDEWKKFGLEKPTVLIVRPDMYIGLVSDTLTQEIINSYFNKIGIPFS